jgi:hypothetical protein
MKSHGIHKPGKRRIGIYLTDAGHPKASIKDGRYCSLCTDHAAANRSLLPEGLSPFAISLEVSTGKGKNKEDLKSMRTSILGGCFPVIHSSSKK